MNTPEQNETSSKGHTRGHGCIAGPETPGSDCSKEQSADRPGKQNRVVGGVTETDIQLGSNPSATEWAEAHSSHHGPSTNLSFKVRVPRRYPLEIIGHIASDLMAYGLGRPEVCRKFVGLRSLEKYDALAAPLRPPQCIPDWEHLAETDVAAEYLLAMYLKKYCETSSDVTRREAALKKFKAAERQCHLFNGREYRKLLSVTCTGDVQLAKVLDYARHWIRSVLSEHVNYRSILRGAKHGPGSTATLKHEWCSEYFKYLRWPYSCPEDAVDLAVDAIHADPRWDGVLEDDLRRTFEVQPWVYPFYTDSMLKTTVIDPVSENRVCLVPKDRTTDRTIAAEPTMGVYLQLGVDSFIRRRLKRYRIDLDSQLKNRILAREGSIADTHATLDLESASDTVSLRICQLLLPREWYYFLCTLRSKYGRLPDGTRVRYGKISSMGNGFTFVLESLIFAALAAGVMRQYYGYVDWSQLAVYGDDIVVPKHCALQLSAVLANCGFTVNQNKSFIKGSFKESCGTDWWRGRNIRPVFLRRPATTVPELFGDYNRLSRWFELRGGIPFEETQTAQAFRRWLPEIFWKCVGPVSDDDFESYRHSHCMDRFLGSCRPVWRVVSSMSSTAPRRFEYAKLMAHLLPSISSRDPWDKQPSLGGTAFCIPKETVYRLRKSALFVGQVDYRNQEVTPL